MKDDVCGLDLPEITKKVDDLWGQIKQKRQELRPLLYAAWKLFEGKRGRPEVGTETFSSWLAARSIPRKTGYRMLGRERTARGELIVSGDTVSQPEPASGSAAGAANISENQPPEADDSGIPLHVQLLPEPKKPELVKSTRERKTELIAELVKLKGQEEADKIIDTLLVNALEAQLGALRRKSPQTAQRMQQQHKSLMSRLAAGSVQEVA